MNRKDNFRKAAYDMFGVGGKAPEERQEPPKEAPRQETAAPEELFAEAVRPAEPPEPAAPKYQTTVLAAGSVFEGTLRAKGSVDLACEFRGNIFAEGDVVMRTSLEGNVQGKCVELIACAVQGDITAANQLKVHRGSSIRGNIATRDLICSGRIEGDIAASGHVVLESDATLAGNLTASTLSIDEGATIEGNLKVSRSGK